MCDRWLIPTLLSPKSDKKPSDLPLRDASRGEERREQMLDLQKQHQQAEAGKEDARFALQKRIQALDEEIDADVYRLYGMTEDEIKVVEGG
jgi:hypothetical protein